MFIPDDGTLPVGRMRIYRKTDTQGYWPEGLAKVTHTRDPHGSITETMRHEQLDSTFWALVDALEERLIQNGRPVSVLETIDGQTQMVRVDYREMAKMQAGYGGDSNPSAEDQHSLDMVLGNPNAQSRLQEQLRKGGWFKQEFMKEGFVKDGHLDNSMFPYGEEGG